MAGSTFLNFGAGHGGVSHLVYSHGLNVINVEPGNQAVSYSHGFSTIRDIDSVPDCSVDIVYGSHSLEHVADIEWAKAQVERVLKPPGRVFWEVPNCDNPGLQVLAVPHSYYFREVFFEKWLRTVVYSGCFDGRYEAPVDILDPVTQLRGQVLRVVGTLFD